MRHRFNHAQIGAKDAFQQILAVAGERQRGDLPDARAAEVAE